MLFRSLMLVSLPSKTGDVSTLVAYLPQSQYCCLVRQGVGVIECVGTYGLGSVISTFPPQRLFIGPGIVPVPGEEVALGTSQSATQDGRTLGNTHGSVDSEGVLHVDGDKVIVPRLCAGILHRVELGWRLGETCNSVSSNTVVGLQENPYREQRQCMPSFQR